VASRRASSIAHRPKNSVGHRQSAPAKDAGPSADSAGGMASSSHRVPRPFALGGEPQCPPPPGIPAENAGHCSARPDGGHALITDELTGLPAIT
jgi:hypothetical protein